MRVERSHAQRDVLDLTLVAEAFRSNQAALASALAAERHLARPESPLAQLFARRRSAVVARLPLPLEPS